jgi:mannose-6-phosphate isomerase-like protein (cupin superfamily)
VIEGTTLQDRPVEARRKHMGEIVQVDEVAYEEVEWGLTKEIIAPQTVGSKRVKVKITEYLPGYSHTLHVHPNQEEVIYVLSGRGVTESRGHRREIGPGSVVFISAGEPHANFNLSDSEALKVIVIKAPPEDEEVKMGV